ERRLELERGWLLGMRPIDEPDVDREEVPGRRLAARVARLVGGRPPGEPGVVGVLGVVAVRVVDLEDRLERVGAERDPDPAAADAAELDARALLEAQVERLR